MPHKRYFSYVRVSTQRQGQFGTSLTEQRSAIERYAQKFDFTIVKHFEERETAAKLGRPVFLEMIKELRQGKVSGVIIHKIDRSARNLKDWADLGSLIDAGVEVHFASESLDLNSRGGRLSADIQAVVASDYIRNLREETKKGLYGRLKQGIYPFRAVTGYLDTGKGQPKKIDKIRAPLIRRAFELYSTGNWGLIALADELYERGLRNRQGKKITINGLSTILHNPFYIGLMRIEKTGEMFAGRHKSIVSKALFDQVQTVFSGKNVKKTEQHFFLFRRQVSCAKCGNFYIAEKQKGRVYYRCHTRRCTKGGVLEEAINNQILKTLKDMKLDDFEYRYFKTQTAREEQESVSEFETNHRRLQLLRGQIKDRLSKLADAYVDAVFDKETYIEKKNGLLIEDQSIKEKLVNLKQDLSETVKRMDEFLELLNSAYLSYEWGEPREKLNLVKSVFSNCRIDGKNVLVKPYFEFEMMITRPRFTAGSQYREATRTSLRNLYQKLFNYFKKQATTKSDNNSVNYINSKQEKDNKYNSPELNN